MKHSEPPSKPPSFFRSANKAPSADIDPDSSLDANPSPGQVTRKSYIRRHWRGELSLQRSFWINGFLTNLVFGILISLFSKVLFSFDSYTGDLKILFISHISLLTLAIVISLWQVVGIWRSAVNYLKQSGSSSLWGNLAKLSVIIGIIGLIGEIQSLHKYPLMEFYKIAFEQDSLGTCELRVLRNQTELEISGAITFGLTEEVKKTLLQYPGIHLIHLNSEGGRVAEARKLRDLIDDRGLITFTSSSCSSACTIAYAAGKERLIGKGATLGFHQSSLPGVSKYDLEAEDNKTRKDWKARGFNKAFIDKAFSTPGDQLWKPSHRELFEYGFVTGYPKSDDVAMTRLSSKQVDNLNELLLENPLFSALKTHAPDTYALITAELQSGMREGQSLSELRKKIFPLIQPIYSQKIPYASDAALRSLMSLSLEQMSTLEAIDPSLCYDYIYGQDENRVEIVELFSETLRQKELAVMTDIIISSTQKTPRPYNRKQAEKQLQSVFSSLRKKHGNDAHMLLNSQPAASDKARICRLTNTLYASILELPEEKSGAILRFMLTK